jgi:hypothetical protein
MFQNLERSFGSEQLKYPFNLNALRMSASKQLKVEEHFKIPEAKQSNPKKYLHNRAK